MKTETLVTLCLQGILAGMDAKSNIILSDSTERVYSADEGVQEVPLGLYLVKGDAMCVPCSCEQTVAVV